MVLVPPSDDVARRSRPGPCLPSRLEELTVSIPVLRKFALIQEPLMPQDDHECMGRPRFLDDFLDCGAGPRTRLVLGLERTIHDYKRQDNEGVPQWRERKVWQITESDTFAMSKARIVNEPCLLLELPSSGNVKVKIVLTDAPD